MAVNYTVTTHQRDNSQYFWHSHRMHNNNHRNNNTWNYKDSVPISGMYWHQMGWNIRESVVNGPSNDWSRGNTYFNNNGRPNMPNYKNWNTDRSGYMSNTRVPNRWNYDNNYAANTAYFNKWYAGDSDYNVHNRVSDFNHWNVSNSHFYSDSYPRGRSNFNNNFNSNVLNFNSNSNSNEGCFTRSWKSNHWRWNSKRCHSNNLHSKRLRSVVSKLGEAKHSHLYNNSRYGGSSASFISKGKNGSNFNLGISELKAKSSKHKTSTSIPGKPTSKNMVTNNSKNSSGDGTELECRVSVLAGKDLSINAIKLNSTTPNKEHNITNTSKTQNPEQIMAGANFSKVDSPDFNIAKGKNIAEKNTTIESDHNGNITTKDSDAAVTKIAKINESAEQVEIQQALELLKQIPVIREKREILKAVEKYRVILLAGAKGCGKSSQVPQIIMDHHLSSGRSSKCRIVCAKLNESDTHSLATFVASVRNETVGKSIDVMVQRKSRTFSHTPGILYCTYEVLLDEIVFNGFIKTTNFLILDDINERDVRINRVMGSLKGVLQSLPNLKIILLSFTNWEDSFYDYFGKYHVLYICQKQVTIDLTSNNSAATTMTIDLTESDNELISKIVPEKPIENDLQNGEDKQINYNELPSASAQGKSQERRASKQNSNCPICLRNKKSCRKMRQLARRQIEEFNFKDPGTITPSDAQRLVRKKQFLENHNNKK